MHKSPPHHRIKSKKEKAKRKIRQARPLTPEVLALMTKVKGQIEQLSKPIPPEQFRRPPEQLPDVTPSDYRKLDPMADSTMSGALAGRPVDNFNNDFPKAFSLLSWIKADLSKWPWRLSKKSA